MSATPDNTLADSEQLIAILRRRLAEREAELAQALEQQTATAEVLQVINSSPGNLAPVWDAMLERATRICEAAFGGLAIFDGEQFRFVAAHGVPDFVEYSVRPAPDGSAPLEQLARGEPLIHLADARAVDAYRELPSFRSFVDRRGVRTHLAVSLRKDGALLGAIGTYRQDVRPFSDKQVALLQNFAAQAVIAMENARLLTETREALEQQTATAEILQVINSSPGDLEPVFEAILEKAHILCGAAKGALAIKEGEHFRSVATRGLSLKFATLLREPRGSPPNSPPQRLLAGENLVHIPDIGTVDLPIPRAAAELDGVQTVLFVPLRKDNALLGYITAYRQEIRPFNNTQIALLENFAAQAVIAMENARLITETREALDQQTATAEVLGVINSSPGDLLPVFDAILEKAHSLCGAELGTLFTYDGERFWRVAGRRETPAPFRELILEGFRPGPGNPFARVLEGERLVHITDVGQVAAQHPDDPGLRAAVETGIMRTFLIVPLRKDDVLLGAITAIRREVQPFSDKQIALLQNFAAQAVIAMENARLITETREALDQQTATAEVLQVINSSPGDLTPVFNAMLEKAHALCGVTIGALEVWDGERIRALATRGLPEPFEKLIRQGYEPGPNDAHWQLLNGARFVHIPDQAAVDDPMHRKAAELTGVRTFLSVALRKDNTLLGRIVAGRQEVRPFAEKEIALLESFAAQAVIAMENARLLTETREALDQQTATAEVLQVINSSPGDLGPVFDAMLEKAHSLCGAPLGSLVLYDGQQLRAVATRGYPQEYEALARRGISFTSPLRRHPFRRLLDGEPFVHSEPATLEGPNEEYPMLRAAVEIAGIRYGLFVPLRKDATLLGYISAQRQEVRPFSDKQIALLQNFAAQAVIAMENARLLGELRQRTEEVAELNRGLEARVAEQLDELGRVGRLKRFLAPQLAEMIVSQGDEKILESHRREIVVVFCDLRGYTAFTETAEPEEVLDFLREYHGALGPLVSQFEGTLDQFSGDGIMVFFNDPVPCPDPAERAVKMAVAMREAAETLTIAWRRRGRVLGFGAGIAQGYATLGQIGFADRSGYTAIGTVCNLAARLCAEAKDGQILVAQRVAVAVEETMPLEEVGELTLKGLTQPVAAFNVPLAAIQPALRVIEGGPQSV
jgi:GAF domain-containing protein